MDILDRKRAFFIKIMPKTSPKTGLGKNTMSLQNLFLLDADFNLSSTSPHSLPFPPKNQPEKKEASLLLPSPPPSLPTLPISGTSRRKENIAREMKKRTTATIWCLPDDILLSPPSPHLFSGKCSKIQCLQGLRGIGKGKERKKAAGLWYRLLFCFFSSYSLKKKARKPSDYRCWERFERRRRGRLYIPS